MLIRLERVLVAGLVIVIQCIFRRNFLAKTGMILSLGTIIITIAVIFILFIYSAINGIPFGGMYAKYKLKNYVKQVYNISIVSKANYNVVNADYYVTVNNNPNFELEYSLYDNTINDGRVYRACFWYTKINANRPLKTQA